MFFRLFYLTDFCVNLLRFACKEGGAKYYTKLLGATKIKLLKIGRGSVPNDWQPQ